MKKALLLVAFITLVVSTSSFAQMQMDYHTGVLTIYRSFYATYDASMKAVLDYFPQSSSIYCALEIKDMWQYVERKSSPKVNDQLLTIGKISFYDGGVNGPFLGTFPFHTVSTGFGAGTDWKIHAMMAIPPIYNSHGSIQ
jgi:hypothetical protein